MVINLIKATNIVYYFKCYDKFYQSEKLIYNFFRSISGVNVIELLKLANQKVKTFCRHLLIYLTWLKA